MAKNKEGKKYRLGYNDAVSDAIKILWEAANDIRNAEWDHATWGGPDPRGKDAAFMKFKEAEALDSLIGKLVKLEKKNDDYFIHKTLL